MKAKKIHENLSNIFKSKTLDDIQKILKPELRELVDDAYRLFKTSDDFYVTSDIGFQPPETFFNFEIYYGFSFESAHTDEKFYAHISDNDFIISEHDPKNPDETFHNHYIEDLNQLLFTFKLYDVYEEDPYVDEEEFIYEDLNNLLKPKSEKEITSKIPEIAKNVINKAYEKVKNIPNVKITSNISVFIDDEEFIYYGFKFLRNKMKESFGFYPELGSYYLNGIYENTKIKDLQMLINKLMREEIIESLDDEYVNERLDDNIFKPKDYDELKTEFEKKNPYFTKIFKEMFPNKRIDIETNPHFVFVKYGIVFLINKHEFKKFPTISYLDKRYKDIAMSGIFKHHKVVTSKEDVMEYVNDILTKVK